MPQTRGINHSLDQTFTNWVLDCFVTLTSLAIQHNAGYVHLSTLTLALSRRGPFGASFGATTELLPYALGAPFSVG